MSHRFEVLLDQLGTGSVKVDGIDLSSLVSRVTVDAKPGDPTCVYLEATQGGSFEGTGLVFDRSDNKDVVQFLENVDAIALESAAMAMLEGLDGTVSSPTVAMLAVLQEWASGNDNRT